MPSKIVKLKGVAEGILEDEFESANICHKRKEDCDFVFVLRSVSGLVRIVGHGEYELTQDIVDDIKERAESDISGISVDSQFFEGENCANFTLKD